MIPRKILCKLQFLGLGSSVFLSHYQVSTPLHLLLHLWSSSPLPGVICKSSMFSCSSSLEILNKILNTGGDFLSRLPPIFRSENWGPNQLPWFFNHSKSDIYVFQKYQHIKAEISKIHTTQTHIFFSYQMLHASTILYRQISTKVNQLNFCSPNINIPEAQWKILNTDTQRGSEKTRWGPALWCSRVSYSLRCWHLHLGASSSPACCASHPAPCLFLLLFCFFS